MIKVLVTVHFPVLVIVVSLISAFTILAVGLVNKRACWVISTATILLQLVMALSILDQVLTDGTIHYRMGGWMPPWGIEYVIDALNAYVLIVVLFLGLVCVIYSKRSVEQELPSDKIVPFYIVYQLLITGLCGIIVTGDIFNMYVFLEISSLAAYALIAAAGGKSLKASFVYLVLGSIGACFFLLGIGFLYAVTGTPNITDLSLLLPPFYGNRLVQAAFVFFAVGLIIKIALFPLHSWQPDVYEHAPSAVSVIISTAAAKTFVYAFIRIIFSVFTLDFINQILPVFDIMCWVAALAMIAGETLDYRI